MLTGKLIGNTWLKQQFGLEHSLTHQSQLGTRLRTEIDQDGNIIDTYPTQYDVGDSVLAHIEFSLKYDHLNLDLLRTVFKRILIADVVTYVNEKPKGIYQRRIGYLFELLMQNQLPVADTGKTNYIDLIDPEKYITGKTEKINRWWINDNLLGTWEFSPIIRRTSQLMAALEPDFKEMIRDLTKTFPPEIFHRAVNYLYKKETKSSYQIEREEPSPDRMERFISILEKAGEDFVETLLEEKNLTMLQNAIVDPRFAAKGFRSDQNFISSTNYSFKEIYHYISPPPQFVTSLMNGLRKMATKIEPAHSIVQSASAAFAFVYIHPFEDGNGRIHRFLIHDFLIRGGIVERGMIVPVSAHMVNHMREYDRILETYSKPLMKRVKFKVHDNQGVTVTNPDDIEGYYRYPDFTEHSTYLATVIRATIQEDIFQEMDFIQKYDEAKSAIQQIADIPDRMIDQLIRVLHNNGGRMSKRKRDKFEKLTDEEIARIEVSFQEVFLNA